MGASSNPHATGVSAITTLKVVIQVKTQRTCQILEQKNGMVETRKARTDLRVWSYSNKTQKISQKQKSD